MAKLHLAQEILDIIYPVGSIYMSEVLGKLLLGRFLLGCNSTYAAGTTGGEATHVLSWDEMPKHVHPYQTIQDTGSTSEFGLIFDTGQGRWTARANVAKNTSESGNSKAHNNMPPYLSVYIWKRTK